MYNNSSGIFPTLVFLFVVFLVGGIILSQFVGTLTELNTKTNELDKTIKQLHDTSTSLEEARGKIDNLQSDLDAERQLRQGVEQTLQVCSSTLTNITAERDGVAQQLAGVTSEKNGLAQKLADMTAERNGWINLATALNTDHEDLHGQVNSLTTDHEAQIKLANHYLDEVAVLRSQLERIPNTGIPPCGGTEKNATNLKVNTDAWWLLTLPLVIACFSGYEIYRVWDKVLIKLGLGPKNAKIQVKMTRAQLDAYLRWQRSEQQRREQQRQKK